MTRKTNARLAGSAYLLYIVAGISSMFLFSKAVGGAEGTAAKLASIVQHATLVRVTVLLAVVMFMCAVVLGVTLYALTREEDRDLALLALICRAIEGANNIAGTAGTMKLLSFASTSTVATSAADASAMNVLGASMLNRGDWAGNASVIGFVIATAIFSYLFLRARTIPAWLAWFGVLASVLLLVAIPVGLVAAVNVPFLVWIPMLIFELIFAGWLIIKGVAAPRNRESTYA